MRRMIFLGGDFGGLILILLFFNKTKTTASLGAFSAEGGEGS